MDVLTNSGSVTGQTDSFQWNQFDSLADDVVVPDELGVGVQSFSMADTGTETLAAKESHPDSLTVVQETDQFDMQDAFAAFASEEPYTLSLSQGFSFDDIGNDSVSGYASSESDSYAVSDWEYRGGPSSYTLLADGTDSLSGGHEESTFSYHAAGSAETWPYGDGRRCSAALMLMTTSEVASCR